MACRGPHAIIPYSGPMFQRCKMHKEIEIARRYQRPLRAAVRVSDAFDQDERLEIINGFTTIETRCFECGRLEHYRVPGDQTGPSDA